MGTADLNFDQNSGDIPFKTHDSDFFGVVRTTIGERNTFFDVETNFVKDPWVSWLNARWKDTFVYAAIYVVIVFGGQRLMKNRERFQLTALLTVWNVCLAGFSIMGAISCTSEFLDVLIKKGFHASVVDMGFYDGASGFWVLLFTLSKLVELGDTMFIVVRKQPLIFLHWYHHLTTLIYCWNSYAEQTGTGRWFVAMNYCVHSLMYSYYALRAMKFKVPRFVMVTITSLQILQMFVGVGLNGYVFRLKIGGFPVHQTWRNFVFVAVMYASYFLLFSNFFYRTYVVAKKQQHQQQKPIAEEEKKKSS